MRDAAAGSLPRDQLVVLLHERTPPAALATELSARLQVSRAELDDLLDATTLVLVVPHSAPDPHLESTDLRVFALLNGSPADEEAQRAAYEAAEQVWADWLRQFLATHRCS